MRRDEQSQVRNLAVIEASRRKDFKKEEINDNFYVISSFSNVLKLCLLGHLIDCTNA